MFGWNESFITRAASDIADMVKKKKARVDLAKLIVIRESRRFFLKFGLRFDSATLPQVTVNLSPK